MARAQNVQIARPLPHAPAGERLPEHHARGEDVGARVDLLPARLLRRHVRDLAFEDAGARLLCRVRGLGDAEVDDLHLPLERDEHVLRAHVAVHDAERRPVEVGELVRVLEAGEQLAEDLQLHVRRERRAGGRRPSPDAIERATVQVVHRHEVAIAFVPDLVRLDDVRVVEARREAGLVEEHREERRILDEVRLQLLHDDELVKAPRPLRHREVHDAHPAARNLGDELVLPEGPTLIGCH